MPFTGLIKMSAFLGMDITNFETNLQKSQRKLKKFGSEMKKVGTGLSIGITLPVIALGSEMLKAGSDAEETGSKFATVFKDISKEAEASAKSLRDSYGLSRQESKKLLTDTGDLLSGFGFTSQKSLELSTSVQKLAVDLASFTNIEGGAERASKALTKALLGERESAKELGIAILEADVKQRLLEKGQANLTGAALRQAKAFATLELATEQSKNAIGDFARTQGSYANQQRALQAELKDLSASFGKLLLPIATELVGVFRSAISVVDSLSPATKKLTLIVAGLAAAIGPVLTSIGFLTSSLIPAAVTGFGSLVTVLSGPLGLVALVAGLAAAYVAVTKAKEQAIKDDIGKKSFQELKQELQSVSAELKKTKEDMNGNSFAAQALNNQVNTLTERKRLLEEEFKKRDLQQWASLADERMTALSKTTEKNTESFQGLNLELEGIKKFSENFSLSQVDEQISQLVSNARERLSSLTGRDLFGKKSDGLTTTNDQGDILLSSDPTAGEEEKPDTFAEFEGLPKLLEDIKQKAKEANEPVKDLENSFATGFNNAANSAKGFAETLKDSIKGVIKGLIAKGIAGVVSNTLAAAGASGPFAVALAGIAGAGAAALFSSIVPKFAKGGLAFGPSLGMVGEGPNISSANPEVIAPLSDLKKFIGPNSGGQNVHVSGEFELSFDKLIAAFNRGNKELATY